MDLRDFEGTLAAKLAESGREVGRQQAQNAELLNKINSLKGLNERLQLDNSNLRQRVNVLGMKETEATAKATELEKALASERQKIRAGKESCIGATEVQKLVKQLCQKVICKPAELEWSYGVMKQTVVDQRAELSRLRDEREKESKAWEQAHDTQLEDHRKTIRERNRLSEKSQTSKDFCPTSKRSGRRTVIRLPSTRSYWLSSTDRRLLSSTRRRMSSCALSRATEIYETYEKSKENWWPSSRHRSPPHAITCNMSNFSNSPCFAKRPWPSSGRPPVRSKIRTSAGSLNRSARQSVRGRTPAREQVGDLLRDHLNFTPQPAVRELMGADFGQLVREIHRYSQRGIGRRILGEFLESLGPAGSMIRALVDSLGGGNRRQGRGIARQITEAANLMRSFGFEALPPGRNRFPTVADVNRGASAAQEYLESLGYAVSSPEELEAAGGRNECIARPERANTTWTCHSARPRGGSWPRTRSPRARWARNRQ